MNRLHTLTEGSPRPALIVDAGRASSARFAGVLAGLNFAPITCTTAKVGLAEFRRLRPALVVIHFRAPDGAATDLLRYLTTARVLVIVVAAEPTIRNAVDAIPVAAREFLDTATDVTRLREAAERLSARFLKPVREDRSEVPRVAAASFADFQYEDLFDRSAAMAAIEARVLEIAETDVPVLIEGEAGVGKSLIARAIHQHSWRRTGPVVKVNCRALPPDLLEAELFGYEIDGATEGIRAGHVERAHGGTLILAEVGDFPANLQTRLLRLLDDREFFRVNGRALVRANVRVIATTRRHLNEQPRSFDPALYDRLAVAGVRIPPLRERREQILSLLEYFLHKFARELDRPQIALSRHLTELCERYHWPGNVSELENLVKRLVVLGDEERLKDDLQTRIRLAKLPPTRVSVPRGLEGTIGLDDGLRPFVRDVAKQAEWAVIRQTLQDVQWNRAAAARRLKISYKTLSTKLKHAIIPVPRRRSPM